VRNVVNFTASARSPSFEETMATNSAIDKVCFSLLSCLCSYVCACVACACVSRSLMFLILFSPVCLAMYYTTISSNVTILRQIKSLIFLSHTICFYR
jgi:hypothetical protein